MYNNIDIDLGPRLNNRENDRATSILNNNVSRLSNTSISTTERNTDFSLGEAVINSNTNRVSRNANDSLFQVEEEANVIRETILSTSEYDDVSLELYFDIIGNDFQNYSNPIDTLRKITETKNLVIDAAFKNVENKFKSLLKKINNYEFITDRIKDKVNNSEDLHDKFTTGLALRKETIKKLSYIDKLKKFVINKQQGKEFNKITNYFISNYDRNFRNNFEIDEATSLFDFENDDIISAIKCDDINDEQLRRHLMIDISKVNEISKTVDYTNLIIQNLVNNVRSIYAPMPGCLFKNKTTANNLYTRYEDDSIFVYTSEINSSVSKTLWDSILVNRKFDDKDFSDNTVDNTNFINNISPFEIRIKGVNNVKLSNEVIEATLTIENIFTRNITSELLVFKNFSVLTGFQTNNSSSYRNFSYKKINANFIGLFSKILISQLLKPTPEQISFLTHNVEGNIKQSSITNLKNLYSTNFFNILDNIEKARDVFRYSYEEEGSSPKHISYSHFDYYSNNIPLTNIYHKKVPIITNDTLTITASNGFNTTSAFDTLTDISNAGNINSFINADVYQNSTNDYTTGERRINSRVNNVTSYEEFDNNSFVIKVDSLIKRVKISYLKNLNLDLFLFNEIAKNIKNSDLKTLMNAYISEDKEKISILSNKNKAYNLLFEENESNEVFSNFSFNNLPRKIQNKMFRAAIDPIVQEENIENIISVFSNYYPNNIFFSSTTFLKKVLSDCKYYMVNTEFKKSDYNNKISELLYLHYINESFNPGKQKEKESIVERFIIAAIKNDTVSDSRISNSEELFQYDINVYDDINEKISEEISEIKLDQSKKSEYFSQVGDKIKEVRVKKSKEYIESSTKLKVIEDSVFGKSFIKKISEECNYSFVVNDFSSYADGEHKTFIIDQFFPYTSSFLFSESDFTSEEAIKRYKDIISNKNIFFKRSVNIVAEGFEDQDRNNISTTDFFIEQSAIDYFIDGKIKKRLSTSNTKGSKKTDITDDFYSLTIDDTSIFSKICEVIRTVLRTISKDYAEKYFTKDEEVLSFINENKEIKEVAKVILEIYSVFFIDMFKKINFDFTTSYFGKIIDPYVDDNDKFLTKTKLSEELSRFDEGSDVIKFNLIKSLGVSRNSISKFVKKDSEQNRVPLEYKVSENVIDYYSELLSYFDKSGDNYKVDNIFERNGLFFEDQNGDVFCRKMYSVINTLKKSDLYQALSFDLTRELVRNIYDIGDNLDKINNEELLQFASSIDMETEDFLKQIDNKYYQNMLIRNIDNVSFRNNEIKEKIIDPVISSEESLEEVYKSINMFDIVKDETSYKQVNINDDVIYCFNLPYEKLETIGDDTIIKLTLIPKDVRNTNKVFYPLTYYFSPNLISRNFNIGNITSNYIFNENSNLNDSELNGVYLEGEAIIEEVKEYLRNVISKKFNLRETNNINLILDDILINHENSVNLHKMLYSKHDINLKKSMYNNSEEMLILSNAVSDNLFRNVFDIEKSSLQEKLNEAKFNEINLMNESVNSLMSIGYDNEIIKNTKIYDRYVISVKSDYLIYNEIDADLSFNLPENNIGQFRSSVIRAEAVKSTSVKNNLSMLEVHGRFDNNSFSTLDINDREFLTFIVDARIF